MDMNVDSKGKEDEKETKVLLLGHSFARRAADICPFRLDGVVVYAFGVSGGSVDDLQQSWVTATLEVDPDVVYIQSGENDIGIKPFDKIAKVLFDFAKYLSARGRLVVLGSLFRRYICRNNTPFLYEIRKSQINLLLKAKCKREKTDPGRIFYSSTNKDYQTCENFLPDGVHLLKRTQLLWVSMVATFCQKLVNHLSKS